MVIDGTKFVVCTLGGLVIMHVLTFCELVWNEPIERRSLQVANDIIEDIQELQQTITSTGRVVKENKISADMNKKDIDVIKAKLGIPVEHIQRADAE